MVKSSSSTPRNRRLGQIAQTMRDKPLVSFFVLAYGVSWLLWIPVVILGLPVINPTTQAPSLYILPGIAIGVTGSAFLMTAVTQGKAGVRRLLQRLTWWRVAPQWFAVAVLVIPLSEWRLPWRSAAPTRYALSLPRRCCSTPPRISRTSSSVPCSKNQAGEGSRSPACSIGSAPSREACCSACCGWRGTCSCTDRHGFN